MIKCIIVLPVLCFILSGCGQSGALYLPDNKAKGDNAHSEYLVYQKDHK